METDADLLVAWKAGDKTAGNELLSRHFESIRRFFASKIQGTDVKDLVQRTFTAAVEACDRFRGDSTFSTFLFCIARRLLYRHLRDSARDRGRSASDVTVSSVVELGQSPTSAIAGAQREKFLLEALQRVSVQQQAMLELHYWENLGSREIAEILEIEPGAVRTRLHRARAAVLKVLRELMGSEADSMDVDDVARTLGLLV